jgi:hypothetical protein
MSVVLYVETWVERCISAKYTYSPNADVASVHTSLAFMFIYFRCKFIVAKLIGTSIKLGFSFRYDGF